MEGLTRSDIETFKAFLALVKKGKFSVQGEALQRMGGFFAWAENLPRKMEATLFPPKPKTEVTNGNE